ncbi:MAG: hypothetical protein ABRQ39_28900 [Candidatus Eremiobacterota bacterium]
MHILKHYCVHTVEPPLDQLPLSDSHVSKDRKKGSDDFHVDPFKQQDRYVVDMDDILNTPFHRDFYPCDTLFDRMIE